MPNIAPSLQRFLWNIILPIARSLICTYTIRNGSTWSTSVGVYTPPVINATNTERHLNLNGRVLYLDSTKVATGYNIDNMPSLAKTNRSHEVDLVIMKSGLTGINVTRWIPELFYQVDAFLVDMEDHPIFKYPTQYFENILDGYQEGVFKDSVEYLLSLLEALPFLILEYFWKLKMIKRNNEQKPRTQFGEPKGAVQSSIKRFPSEQEMERITEVVRSQLDFGRRVNVESAIRYICKEDLPLQRAVEVYGRRYWTQDMTDET